MKKLVSFILLLGMVVSLAACGDQSSENSEASGTTSSEKAETSDSDNSAQSREHMEISVGYFDADKVANAAQKDAILRMLEEKFNVTFTWKGVSWSDYREKYKLWAAAGELPDVFGTNEKATETYYSWINQGIVKEFPEDLSKYPLIKATLEREDVVPLQVNGKNYMLPRSNEGSGVAKLNDRSILMRKDWLKAAGLEVPTDFESFVEVVSQIQEMDIDGNGVKDTVGVTTISDWALEVFFMDLEPAFSSWSWIEKDGVYVPHYLSDQAVPAIKRMKLMYENGVLDPDFAILQQDDGLRKFAAGNAVALTTKSGMRQIYDVKKEWVNFDHDVEFEDAIAVVPLWANEEGIYNSYNDTSFWSETYMSSYVNDEKADRILEILEYFLGDEFKEICKYGMEGEDFTVEGDVYTLMDEELVIMEKYPSMKVFTTFATWNFNSQLERSQYNDFGYGEDVVRLAMDHYEKHVDIATPSEVTFDIRFLDLPSKNKLSGINFMEDVTRIVVSGNDVQEEWDKTLENYHAQGVEQAITEVNEIINK